MDKLVLSKIKTQCIAEFFGTGLMTFLGIGCIANMKLIGTPFSQWEISIVWGMSVAMAIYLTANISGAHLNPAITIAHWLFSNFEKYKVVPYIISQVLGAFCAAALIYVLYYNFFIDYEQLNHIIRGSMESLDLASIFSTYPNQNISIFQAFLIETLVTAVLLCLILAITDDNNGVSRSPLAPFLIGILIAVISSSIGPLTGAAMNPARDFGPKTLAFFVGWGKIAYTGGHEVPYFLIPLIAPIIGSCFGVLFYRIVIGSNLSSQINKKKTDIFFQ